MPSNLQDIETIEEYTLLFEKYQNFLTQNQKQVFMLYFFENLSYSEIAEIMATSRSAVYDTLKKAMTKLKKISVNIS
ncbi:sigma-70 family RNA polymerase sigma factor [Mycoplasmopsis ciconiae]|uniref:Sigma-70 family RNA polymerase sigma factor n=1 Tax=Mycoplasmopsis ciconiae TaxID=561067 RepID=A0ABU7MKC9_9BACT|nr:sigma-70 family RNA polymerase sigma factor [Mycoplasmopsis ciconiae]